MMKFIEFCMKFWENAVVKGERFGRSLFMLSYFLSGFDFMYVAICKSWVLHSFKLGSNDEVSKNTSGKNINLNSVLLEVFDNFKIFNVF